MRKLERTVNRFLTPQWLYGRCCSVCASSSQCEPVAGSILFLCCISLHRFIGVCYPVRSLYWLSARKAKLISVAVWAVVLLCQGPVLYFSRMR